MGYDIHITRAEEWSDADAAAAITAEEWLEYVKRDPELKLAGYNGPCFALWWGLPNGQIEQDGEVQTGPKMDWREWRGPTN